MTGFFDSGIGGLTTLSECYDDINEKFVYLADAANAPFGEKSRAEVVKSTVQGIGRLVDLGCDTVVIACNTATAVAVEQVRNIFSCRIIGMEPALKCCQGRQNVLALVTPLTSRSDKFMRLKNIFCPLCDTYADGQLVERIESAAKRGGGADFSDCIDYLTHAVRFEQYRNVILGCTHYVYLKRELAKRFSGIKFFDGNYGVCRRLQTFCRSRQDKGVTFLPECGNINLYETLFSRLIARGDGLSPQG